MNTVAHTQLAFQMLSLQIKSTTIVSVRFNFFHILPSGKYVDADNLLRRLQLYDTASAYLLTSVE